MKKTLFFTMICLLLSSSIYSQVTIGKGEKPAAGALLDLKNLDTPGLNGETANKGLMLPRVELSDVSKLYPMLPSGYDVGENAKHNGLVVFNMGAGDVDLCLGIYVWDSQKWNRIPEPCNNSLWSATNLTFYKSALAAKSITLDLSRENAKVTWAHDSAIPWQAGGFPQNDTRKVTKTFSFQPQAHAGATDRTSTITATVNSDGKISTETITITQLAREMLFACPGTVQPVLGAERTLNINSEADWSTTLPAGANNPGNMVTSITGNIHGAGTKDMKITLTNNDTWAERIAKFDITSSNPDFNPRTLEVKQGVATPALVATAPVSKIVDFGEVTNVSNQKQNITFSTNSVWKFTADAQYANVISASTVAANTNTAGGVPSLMQSKTITLTPNGTNTAAAGTPLETKLTFTTVNTGTQPAKTQEVTVKRKVAALFTTPTLTVAASTTLTRAGHTIGLTTNTNRAWWIRQVSSTTTSSNMAANTYASRSLTVAVPANDTWTNRTGIVLAHSINGTAYTTAATYSQAPYDLAYSAHTALAGAVGGKVARAGKSNATVTLRSNNGHPTTNIHLTSNLGTVQFNSLAGVVNPTTEALKNRVYTTAIPVNDSWTERVFTIHFYKNAWVNTGVTFTQHSYDLSSGQGNLPASIGFEARNDLFINTYSTNGCPNFRVGIATALDGNGQPTAWATDNPGGSAGTGNRYFNVPANPSGTARNLYFVFEQTGNKWVNVKTVSQAGQPWIDGGDCWIWNNVTHPDTKTYDITYHQVYMQSEDLTHLNQFCRARLGAAWYFVSGHHMLYPYLSQHHPGQFSTVYISSLADNGTNYKLMTKNMTGSAGGSYIAIPNNKFAANNLLWCAKPK